MAEQPVEQPKIVLTDAQCAKVAALLSLANRHPRPARQDRGGELGAEAGGGDSR